LLRLLTTTGGGQIDYTSNTPGRGMSRPLAESILALDFPEADAARVEELNAKANDGALTEDERAELEAYANIGDLLAYWQSRARQVLQQP